MDLLRTLPLRVALDDGEALDSWLLRLSHRNGLPLRWLTTALGFGDRLRVWRNYALTWKLPPPLLRRIETQAGLPDTVLDAAVLDQFDALGWKPVAGSRFCPTCLDESGGSWPIRWQLPYTFACLTHRCLLAVICPACRRTPHSHISERTGLAPPTRCTLGVTRHGLPCDGDLLTHPPQNLAAADPRLAAQAWINTRLDRPDTAAVTELRDLNALAGWLLHRVDPRELDHLGDTTVTAMSTYRDDNHALKRHPDTAALIAAALACHAITVITADDSHRPTHVKPLLRDVHSAYRTGQTPSTRGPMMLSHQRLSTLSPPLQRSLLQAVDGQLPVTERLRYRTCTTTPRLPTTSAAAERARHVPQYLWPDWVIRFLPARGAHATDVAIDVANALLLPGNPARNIDAVGELNPWRNNTSLFLGQCAEQYPDTPVAICALADYLDTHGCPIDYRRRRTAFTDIDLSPQQWHDLCYEADADPGQARRLLNARRYLFRLLTGADLGNTQHRLAFTNKASKPDLHQFDRELSTPLRDLLHQYGAGLLHDAGIDEPLTWSPPAGCVAGLHLAGREPQDIDLPAVQRLLDVEHLSTTAVARRLNVTVEHIRYAQQQIHRLPQPLHPWSPITARRARERATILLTRDFFEREYHQARRTLHDLASMTGLHRTIVTAHARAHGIRISNHAATTPRPDRAATAGSRRPPRPKLSPKVKTPRPPVIDPDWLRKQAGTLQRANIDIGAELGLSHETVRRHRRNLGIPARPSGSAGHTVQTRTHTGLPDDIRRAVEGKRHGWQRLRRFQQITTHPSVNAAAIALGLHHQNLFLQLDRLENDLGSPLIRRTNNRYTPMDLTPRGTALLELLHTPKVRRLLNRYVPNQPPAATKTPQPSKKATVR